MLTRRILRVPDRDHLRDSSSDEEGEKKQQQLQERRMSSIEMIDLTDSSEPINYSEMKPTTNTLKSASNKHNYPTYVPLTLQVDSPRWSILPAFPTSIYDQQPPPLLLANVPSYKLDIAQRARRQPGVYPLIYSLDKTKSDIPSYFRDSHQSFMSSLIEQYHIDESVLDYNLHRFTQCFQLFANGLIRQHHQAVDYFLLDEQQKRYAFEFYLQVDADLFFMKTCSFRRAKPRSRHEHLFCINKPYPQYGFTPCEQCSLCVPRYNLSCREKRGTMIQFGITNGLTFRNGYRTFLNCPVDCHTNNLIYVMTCPCGHYEYIGETNQRLIDRLRSHRQQFNRISHEFLLGEQDIQKNHVGYKGKEALKKDRMLLYRHAARCPSAMQIFLNFNPIYWRFVPLRHTEAEVQDQMQSTLPSSLILLDPIYPTSLASKDRSAIMATANTRSDESVRSCMRNLPPVPPGYNFSLQQRAQQFQYFKQKHDITHQQNPLMDLFNVAVVAVLPEDASETVRRFVEALFITHTEAKLNTSGRLVSTFPNDSDARTDIPYHLAEGCSPRSDIVMEIQLMDREEWCRDLIFPHHRPYMGHDDQ